MKDQGNGMLRAGMVGLAVCGILVNTFVSAVPLGASQPRKIALFGGRSVEIAVDAPISSSSAKVGDIVGIHAVDSVISNGYVLIRAGSEGAGEIISTDGAGNNGHGGSLSLQCDWVMSVDGLKVKLATTPQTTQGEEKKGAASTMTIIGYAVFGVGGLFAHNLVRGRDATIEPSQKLTAYVDHTVHIAAIEPATDPNDGYEH